MDQKTYRVIDDSLITRIVVDVDGDAAQGGHFRGEFIEAGVVLALGGYVSEVVCVVWYFLVRWLAGGLTYRSRSNASDIMNR